MATGNQATENNQKLFRQYTKKLSQDDISVYASHAEKLGRWLSDEKAYYKTARPEIIKLLLTAQSTLQRNVGAVSDHPMSPFNAVPYSSHPMAGPYIRLIHAVQPYSHLFVEPDLKIFVNNLIQSASPELKTEPPSANSFSANSSNDSPARRMSGVTASCIPLHSDARVYTGNFTLSEYANKPHDVFGDVTSVSTPPASLATGFHTLESSSIPARISPSVSVTNNLEPNNAAIVQTPESVSDGFISAPAPRPKTKKKSRLDLSALLEKDVVAFQQKKLEAMGGATLPITPVKSEPTDGSIGDTIQKTAKAPEIIDLTADESDIENPIIHPVVETIMDVDAEAYEPVPINSHPVTDSVPLNISAPRSLHSATLLHGSTQPVTDNDEHNIVMEVDPADFATNEELSNAQQDKRDGFSDPILITNQSVTEDVNNLSNDTVLHTGQMKIIAIQSGLETASKISIQFEIPAAQFALLSKWIHRRHDTRALQNSLCLSLACYSSSEILKRINEGICRSQEELVSTLQSLWPTSGGLSMTMPLVQTMEEFPLSPPFLATRDGFVDISQFVSEGKNIVELDNKAELTDFTFVLYAHNPTPSQLQQITEQIDKEKQWEKWTEYILRPFTG